MTDTSQLIDRLREYAAMPPDERARGKILNILATCGASADALAAQQKRIKELEAALTEIYEYPSGQPIALGLSEEDWQRRRAEQMRFIARAALAGKGETG